MKRGRKPADSEVLKEGLEYKINGNNTRLRELLKVEQEYYCAYTGKRLDATSLGEIDHFDPTLKGKTGDGYLNWFVIHGQWNKKKGGKTRWNKFQPILHPTHEDFEDRVVFDKKTYAYEWKPGDTEAQNLVKFLFLNDQPLAVERKATISQIRRLVDLQAADFEHILDVLSEYSHLDHFPRAVREFFAG